MYYSSFDNNDTMLTGVCTVPGVPSKSRDLADENKKKLTEWK
jgi:hypothetical protein